MEPEPLNEAREAAHAAYLDAITLGLEERLDVALEAFVDALHMHGVLGADMLTPSPDQLDEAARRLAVASGFPRYDGEGWRRLREPGAFGAHEIRVAYFKATDALRPGQETLALALALDRQRLLAGAGDSVLPEDET